MCCLPLPLSVKRLPSPGLTVLKKHSFISLSSVTLLSEKTQPLSYSCQAPGLLQGWFAALFYFLKASICPDTGETDSGMLSYFPRPT